MPAMDPPPPTWTRLEPHAREANLQYGLNAEVHDPLWFLTRQWQLGEFWGEDAGSPVYAQLEMTCTPITRYQPRGIPPTWIQKGAIQPTASVEGQVLDGTIPLEAIVERESIRREREPMQPVQRVRLAVEAGMHFLRLLSAHGAGALRAKVLTDFPVALPDDQKQGLDADTLRFLQVVTGRVPDGTVLRSGVHTWSGFPKEHREAVDKTVKCWVEWYDSLFFCEPAKSEDLTKPKETAWIPERLEYQALVSAPTSEGEVVLSLSEYADGHLDWYSFNVLPAGSLGAKEDTPAKKMSMSAIPTPVTFRGMPASRYWEFEDAHIDFGGMVAGKQQLAHLLLIEFGLVSGDDWFVIPVTVPVGTLCHTDGLTVHDTFGESTLIESAIKPARALDGKIGSEDTVPWNLFHLSRDTTPVNGSPRPSLDALFLPPTLGTSLHGKALEEVLFLRDEMANMVWAVERTVESPLGEPLNRSEAYARSREKKTVPSVGPEASQTRVYRLASEVPSHWVPMFPVPIIENRGDQLGLALGKQGQARVVKELWEGRVKNPLYGEEVPREGVRVMRAFQYARWTGGETYLWVGRRNEVGRGEGSSGLVFDQLIPPDEN